MTYKEDIYQNNIMKKTMECKKIDENILEIENELKRCVQFNEEKDNLMMTKNLEHEIIEYQFANREQQILIEQLNEIQLDVDIVTYEVCTYTIQ